MSGSDPFPGLTDIHAHPAMNAFLWDRNLNRHYWSGHHFNPLASASDFKMLRKGGVKVLWSSLHVPEREFFDCWYIRLAAHLFSGGRALLKKDAWECLMLQMDEMEDQVRSSKHFDLARSNDELDGIVARGTTAAIVHTVEGGNPLGAGLADDDVRGRLDRLEKLADRGVASLTIAHLFPNELAGHAEGIPEDQRNAKVCPKKTGVLLTRGLTPTGRAVVERMVDLRIIPDVTHCTPVARREVYELVANRIPVVASHIGLESLNGVPYNLDEADVAAIARSGGVVGVIFMPYWLDESHPGKGLDAIWRTMEGIRDLTGGWEHVAIGTDFDGFTDPPDDCHNASKLPKIGDLLDDKGLSRDDREAVLGRNARRVLRNAWR